MEMEMEMEVEVLTLGCSWIARRYSLGQCVLAQADAVFRASGKSRINIWTGVIGDRKLTMRRSSYSTRPQSYYSLKAC